MRLFVSPIFLAIVCIFLGSVIDAVVKGVAASVAVHTILAGRFFTGGAISLALYVAIIRQKPSLRAIRFHAMRAAVQLGAAGLFFWSLTQLALAEATVIGFTSALMIAPLGQLILGERMSRTSVIAALLGFAGAVFAVSAETGGAPADGQRIAGSAAAFVAAALYALTLVLIRLRSREEAPLTIVMFSNVIPGLVLLPVLFTTGPDLTFEQAAILFGLGCAGLSVWWMFSIAYSKAPAQRLAPIEYTALIWSAVLGTIYFAEVPGWRLYLGAIVIIAACLLVSFEDHFATRRAARQPVGTLPD
ncbi:MAG: DMT family transporter [Pseudomonadota bacterium]